MPGAVKEGSQGRRRTRRYERQLVLICEEKVGSGSETLDGREGDLMHTGTTAKREKRGEGKGKDVCDSVCEWCKRQAE